MSREFLHTRLEFLAQVRLFRRLSVLREELAGMYLEKEKFDTLTIQLRESVNRYSCASAIYRYQSPYPPNQIADRARELNRSLFVYQTRPSEESFSVFSRGMYAFLQVATKPPPKTQISEINQMIEDQRIARETVVQLQEWLVPNVRKVIEKAISHTRNLEAALQRPSTIYHSPSLTSPLSEFFRRAAELAIPYEDLNLIEIELQYQIDCARTPSF
jgi:hypothetical protein